MFQGSVTGYARFSFFCADSRLEYGHVVTLRMIGFQHGGGMPSDKVKKFQSTIKLWKVFLHDSGIIQKS